LTESQLGEPCLITRELWYNDWQREAFMLDDLSQKLSRIFYKLSGKGKLSERDIDEALHQVRIALLEADVNFRAVKELLLKVRERALTSEVWRSLTPAQQVIKIVNEELTAILGREPNPLVLASRPPSITLLVGLQGSGKTTTAVKLAIHVRDQGHRPLLVAADTRRPAAVEQLRQLGRQRDIPVYSEDAKVAPAMICLNALKEAREKASTCMIVDTQGRLHIDEVMMGELVEIKSALQPPEILLAVDAMTGQDAVKVAEEFHKKVGLTGLILTKMDGDARGGAALSISFVTGVPIKFIGTGETVDDLEPFYPDRLASRILGMGDVLSLIEKVEKVVDQQQAEKLEKKMRARGFDIEDLLYQLRQVKKMGALGGLVEMIPGFPKSASLLPDDEAERRLKRLEAIILSMTPEERRNPIILNGSRRRRIAQGSGTTPKDLNQLLNQFYQMQKLTKAMSRGKLPRNMLNTFLK